MKNLPVETYTNGSSPNMEHFSIVSFKQNVNFFLSYTTCTLYISIFKGMAFHNAILIGEYSTHTTVLILLRSMLAAHVVCNVDLEMLYHHEQCNAMFGIIYM